MAKYITNQKCFFEGRLMQEGSTVEVNDPNVKIPAYFNKTAGDPVESAKPSKPEKPE